MIPKGERFGLAVCFAVFGCLAPLFSFDCHGFRVENRFWQNNSKKKTELTRLVLGVPRRRPRFHLVRVKAVFKAARGIHWGCAGAGEYPVAKCLLSLFA